MSTDNGLAIIAAIILFAAPTPHAATSAELAAQEPNLGGNALPDPGISVLVTDLLGHNRSVIFADSVWEPARPSLNVWSCVPRPLDEETTEAAGGVGMVIAMDRTGNIFVESVLAKSPAEKAGIKPSDRIQLVNGVPTYGRSVDFVRTLIRGDEHKKVELQVVSKEGTRTIQLQRVFVAASKISSEPFPGNK